MKNDVISPEFDENGRPLRRIRSFVRRQGRLTKGQQHALDNIWPVMGVEFNDAPLDFAALFGREAPVTLEIGFGMGASLVAMAKAKPEQNFLGIEVHSPGVGACLASAEEEGVQNLRVMCHDAVEVLHTMIPDNSLNMVQLFFPDPWHKARHNKRRIVQPPFAELVKSKLKLGGVFHMATDWEAYAEHMLEVMSSLEGYRNRSESNDYVPRPESRPVTKFEQRGNRLGHGVSGLNVREGEIMAKNRSRRLRKKMHIDEFQELGFSVAWRFPEGTSEEQIDQTVNDLIEEVIEPNKLAFDGSGYLSWEGLICMQEIGKCTEEHQAIVRKWLEDRKLADVRTSELFDVWWD